VGAVRSAESGFVGLLHHVSVEVDDGVAVERAALEAAALSTWVVVLHLVLIDCYISVLTKIIHAVARSAVGSHDSRANNPSPVSLVGNGVADDLDLVGGIRGVKDRARHYWLWSKGTGEQGSSRCVLINVEGILSLTDDSFFLDDLGLMSLLVYFARVVA